jgi:hypothetical protein
VRLATKLIPAATALAIALSLSSCAAQFGQSEDEGPVTLPSQSPTPTVAPNTPEQDAALAEIQAELDVSGGALNQSSNDVLDGDNAVLQDDTR